MKCQVSKASIPKLTTFVQINEISIIFLYKLVYTGNNTRTQVQKKNMNVDENYQA